MDKTYFYLENTCESIAIMMDLVKQNNLNIDSFYNIFISSKLANEIENKNIKYLSLSSLDYLRILLKEDYKKIKIKEFNYSNYYWCFYMISLFQYKSNYSFKDINNSISYNKLLEMYFNLNESDEHKIFEIFNKKLTILNKETNLKKYRKLNNLSQKELSIISKVDRRSIEMYEEKKRDINKASALTLKKLADALNIDIETLLEK